MVSSDVVTYVIAGGTIIGGVVCTFVGVFLMDCISSPGERRRRMELAARKDASAAVRQHTVEKLFPANKKYQPKELAEGEEGGVPEEVALCAICIEPFQLDDEVMEGIQCHHEYHHPCMMEWLKQHDDCPVCRKSMWTREAFIEAKKQVFKEHPGTLEMELEAFAAGELAATEAGDYVAGATVEEGDESADVERNAETQTSAT